MIVLYGTPPNFPWPEELKITPQPGEFRVDIGIGEYVCELCGILKPPAFNRHVCDECRALWKKMMAEAAVEAAKSAAVETAKPPRKRGKKKTT